MLVRQPDEQYVLFHLAATPLDALLEAKRLLGDETCTLQSVSEAELDKELQRRYTGSESTSIDNVDDFELDDLELVAAQASEAEDLLDSSDDAPIIRLLNAILAEAIRTNASDIHIEPFETSFVSAFASTVS